MLTALVVLLTAGALPAAATTPPSPVVTSADFAAVMGYEPVPAPGRADVIVSPRGDCSTPTGGTAFGFDLACGEHDLAYDVLRFHALRGETVDPYQRWVADVRFGRRMVERCGERGGVDTGACLLVAGVYSAAVAVNSVRQLYGPPADESGADVAVSSGLMVLLVVLVLLPPTAVRGFRRYLRRADLRLAPPSPSSGWSGSGTSHVRWEDVGREGRRLLAAPPARPGALRLYVGLDSARSAAERAAIAVAEAERSGAFTRGTLCVAVPTGSGWVSTVAVEGLEAATDGDVATLAVQYEAVPSWASLVTRPGAHRRTAGALLRAVHARWSALDPATRPRLVVLGESLGANALAAALRDQPYVARDVAGGLLVGGVGSAAWAPPWRVHLVRHDDDPVVHLTLTGLRRHARRAGWGAALARLARVLRALPSAGSAPEGRGHHYGRELVGAWSHALAPARQAPTRV